LDTIKQQHEPVEMIAVRLCDGKLIDAQVAFLYVCVMALRAVLIEELKGRGREVRSKERGRLHHPQGGEEKKKRC
jgi:ribose 1,5-bisphosphokinase PhnN